MTADIEFGIDLTKVKIYTILFTVSICLRYFSSIQLLHLAMILESDFLFLMFQHSDLLSMSL